MAKWPYAEPDGKLTAEKQIPLESPGAMEGDGLVWLKEDIQQCLLSEHWEV